MQVRATTFALRLELLDCLDQQIEMLSTKTFSAFTKEEMGSFRSREKRIRELQQELAMFPVPNCSLTESLSLADAPIPLLVNGNSSNTRTA